MESCQNQYPWKFWVFRLYFCFKSIFNLKGNSNKLDLVNCVTAEGLNSWWVTVDILTILGPCANCRPWTCHPMIMINLFLGPFLHFIRTKAKTSSQLHDNAVDSLLYAHIKFQNTGKEDFPVFTFPSKKMVRFMKRFSLDNSADNSQIYLRVI